MTVLENKKEIPFTVENMKKAYEAILNNPTASKHPKDIKHQRKNLRITNGNYQINTTHYYIKFSPQDSLQYEKIVNDTILEVSNIPFEYDIQTNGDRYQHPDYTGTDLTYYYSIVPVDYQLPNGVPYENLANLHFTKEDEIPDNAPESQLQLVDFFHDLNTEALKQTNNLEEEKEELLYLFTNAQGQEEKLTWQDAQNRGLNLNELIINFNEEEYAEESKFFRRRKWRPHGRITVEEDAINKNIGVAGARVKVRRWGWVPIRRGRTNRYGYFSTRRTRVKRVKYSVYFEKGVFFTVKAGTIFWNARHIGHRKHKRRGWYPVFRGGRSQFYAFVQNAAYDYYNKIIYQYRLKSPKIRLSINAEYKKCGSSQFRPHIIPITSRIRITRRQKGCRYRGSDGIYATTIHELTHSGHRQMDPGMFSVFHLGSCNRAVLTESWAEGVETIVTNDRYNNLTNGNYSNSSNDNIGYNYRRQRDRTFEMNEYTPIVADLVDNYNQAIEYNSFNPTPPIDRVRGYKIHQIQSALNNCRDINCWENNIYNISSNYSKINLTELFNYVRDVRHNNLKTPCNEIF